MNTAFRIVSLTLALLTPAAALAQSLEIRVTTEEGTEVVEYTADELLALESFEIVTGNDYADEGTVFTGPRIRTLFEDVALERDDTLYLTALDDFKTFIPVAEIFDYDGIIAVLRDGERMSRRGKGPFWVIYPMSDHPELQEPIFNDRQAWQLSQIKVDVTQ